MSTVVERITPYITAQQDGETWCSFAMPEGKFRAYFDRNARFVVEKQDGTEHTRFSAVDLVKIITLISQLENNNG